MKTNRYYWPALLWTLIILYLTLSPGRDIPRISFLEKIANFDKVVHATLFFGFVLLWGVAIIRHQGAFRPSTLLMITLIAISAGIAIEFVQLWWKAIHRDFEIGDIVADAAGALLGAWTISRFREKILSLK